MPVMTVAVMTAVAEAAIATIALVGSTNLRTRRLFQAPRCRGLKREKVAMTGVAHRAYREARDIAARVLRRLQAAADGGERLASKWCDSELATLRAPLAEEVTTGAANR